MRIKHFAGYGCVNARRIKDNTATLHVRVEGNHEQGVTLPSWQTYLLYNWLVRRFDKDAPSAIDWLHLRPIIEIHSDFRTDPKLGVIDTCDYYFTY